MIANLKPLLFKIGLAVLTLGLVVLGALALTNYLSSKEVTFTLSSHTHSIKIYAETYPTQKQKARELASLTGTGAIRLQPGTYYVVASGDGLSNDPIKIEVSDSQTQTVEINPYYSAQYLSTTFSSEIPAITQLLTSTYPITKDRYVIKNGTFRHFGEWYTTILYENNSLTHSAVDVYGVILHKVDDEWKIAASPNLIFSYNDHKDIPKDIIAAINQVVSGY